MKKVWLLLLFSILALAGMAKTEKKTLPLDKGDWIRFEITEYNDTAEMKEVADRRLVENTRKLSLKVTVLDFKEGWYTVGFSVERMTDHRLKSRERGFLYYDSRYDDSHSGGESHFPDRQGKEFTYKLPEENYLTADFATDQGGLMSYSQRDKCTDYAYSLRFIANGIYRKDAPMTYVTIHGDYPIVDIPIAAMDQYLREWFGRRKQAGDMLSCMPSRVNLSDQPGVSLASADIKVTGTSFGFPANTSVTYIHHDKQTLKRKIEREDFYIPDPAIRSFAGKTWLLTPGDSVVLAEDKGGDSRYSGRGAEVNSLANDPGYARLHNYSFREGTSPETINSHLAWEDSTYARLSGKYGEITDPYWSRHFDLSRKYYQAYLRTFALQMRMSDPKLDNRGLVDWDSDTFSSLSPFTDYAYSPEKYASFLMAFVGYKIGQLADDNLTGSKFRWGNYLDYYYLQSQLLEGYPKYSANADVISTLMDEMQLYEISREYNEFINQCPDSTLTNPIKERHRQLSRIEPGASVRGIGLLPLKEFDMKDADSYVLINFSLLPANESDNLRMIDAFKEDLRGESQTNVSFRLYRPESSDIDQLPDSVRCLFRKVKGDMVENNIEKAGGGISLTLLVRGDGTIIYRSLDPFRWYSDKVMEAIREDIKKRETATAGSSFLLGAFYMLCAAMMVGLAVYLRNKARQKAERTRRRFAELEIKALRSQMNPHFIFNALSSIQNLINRPDTEAANRYLLNFAKLLRLVLSASGKRLVTLSGEIEQLRLYLGLEQLRTPFRYTITQDEGVDPDRIELPGMLIQPLAENAVKHGVVPNGGGTIGIRVGLDGRSLVVIIRDDGPGLKEGEPGDTDGFGLRAIRERLALLSADATLAIRSGCDGGEGTGCEVTLRIPIE